MSRLLGLVDHEGKLFFSDSWKGLVYSEDKMGRLICVYEDVPQHFVAILRRKNSEVKIRDKAPPKLDV